MSTEFYIRKQEKGTNTCPRCSCDDVYLYGEDNIKCMECNYTGSNEKVFNKIEEIRVGTRSGGWQFIFGSKFKTAKEWKIFIKQFSDCIFDEYENKIELEKMLEIIEIKGLNGPTASEEQYGADWAYYERFDEEGYRLSL